MFHGVGVVKMKLRSHHWWHTSVTPAFINKYEIKSGGLIWLWLQVSVQPSTTFARHFSVLSLVFIITAYDSWLPSMKAWQHKCAACKVRELTPDGHSKAGRSWTETDVDPSNYIPITTDVCQGAIIALSGWSSFYTAVHISCKSKNNNLQVYRYVFLLILIGQAHTMNKPCICFRLVLLISKLW